MKKFVEILRKIFGVSLLITLFAGALSLVGYIAAICVGGDIAVAICAFIYKQYFPVVIQLTAVSILIGLVSMYLSRQKALTVQTETDESKE